jgi:hypothetical protein
VDGGGRSEGKRRQKRRVEDGRMRRVRGIKYKNREE